MKKRIGRKLLYSLVTLASLMQVPGAYAKISPTAFKRVTMHYKKGKESFSTTLGEAALESGFIYNMRFFGNFKPGKDKEGKRKWINDKSDDSMFMLVHILFPSMAGHLSGESSLETSFGKKVKDPKTVAILLNFVNDLRDLHASTIPRIVNSRDLKIKELAAKATKDILESMGITNNKEQATFKKDTLNSLITAIQGTIENEKESLYPEHTTEQVITAFFCYKFNTQADIWKLLENLDDKMIVDKANLPKQEDYLNGEELQAIAEKSEAYDLDDVFDLAEADIWTALTPYRTGSPLLGNGNAYYFNRTTGELDTSKALTDCAEMAFRHIMNMLLYDNVNREFDLTEIRKIAVTSPYFKSFEDFYEQQPPQLANAGDIKMRSLWNRVVGDLNTDQDPLKIIYKREGANEIRSGFINFVRTFQKIFGLTLKDLPEKGLDARKTWIKESLESIFQTVNPTKTYSFDLKDVTELADDLSGNIDIKVMDAKTYEDLYSFRFYAEPGKHSEIKNLTILKKIEGVDYMEILQTHANAIQPGTTEESLWLVTKKNDVIKNKITHPLYQLFSKPLDDNYSKIAFLDTLDENFDTWKKKYLQTPEKLIVFKGILRNVLADISWDDPSVVQMASHSLRALTKRNELKEILLDTVKGMSLKMLSLVYTKNLKEDSFKGLEHLELLDLNKTSVEKIEGLDILKNLQWLDLSYTENLKDVSLKDLEKLKTLKLGVSSVEKIEDLNTLKKLDSLDLNNTKNLKYVSLSDLEELRFLNLCGSNVEKIEGLDTLKNLDSLDLSNTKNLKDIPLNGLEKLKNLDLGNSSVEKIEDLSTLKSLKTLSLAYTINLKEYSFKGLDNLESLDLHGSSVEKIDWLNILKGLQTLDLKTTNHLTDLTLKGLNQLNSIDLERSKVKKIKLDSLHSLRKLELSEAKDITDISLKNLDKLIKI